VALAESLLPRLKTAEWHDRAEAAVKAGDDIALRDLRSVVAGADAARDEETRELASTLRAALDRRVEALRTEWTSDLTRHLDEGRVVRALQLAGRPPDTGTRLPSDLAERAAAAASAAMNPDTAPDRWMALLEAAAASPVRRTVVPVGLPAEPGADLLRAAHQQSGRIPALAAMLGITIPPPPGPRSSTPPPRPSRPGSSPRRPGGRLAPSAPAVQGPGPEQPSTSDAGAAPESPAPDAPAEEPATPEAVTPDAVAPDASTPDAVAPETSTPDAAAPEAAAPEASTQDAATPEAATPDAGTPDAEAPETSTAEAATPEAATPEAATPEAATPEAQDVAAPAAIPAADQPSDSEAPADGPTEESPAPQPAAAEAPPAGQPSADVAG
jgi:hypothetical protein